VTIRHTPLDLRRARHEITWEGPLEKRYAYERYRDGARHQYDGPDVWGNAMAYGRALYTTQHGDGAAWKIRGREFLIDEDLRLAIVWELFHGDQMTHVVHGLLEWTAAG